MAGYIFSLDSIDSLSMYTRAGVYATRLSAPTGNWQMHHEGTFADYATMQPGDNVYFFIKRRVYGIGKLVEVGTDCKYFNYPRASMPISQVDEISKDQLLWDEGESSPNQRCLCLFKPDPFFFRLGIDMDDVLVSNPSAFKMLRAFWKLSFIKFDDDENQAFRDILLKRNQNVLNGRPQAELPLEVFLFEPDLGSLQAKLELDDYSLSTGMKTVLRSCAHEDRLAHEMAIEAGLLHQLSRKDANTCAIFGEWDYLSHQVIASPFKPVDYMDKMDLFGYAYVPGFRPTRSRYLVGEVKKDQARKEDIDQLLKYVDWVNDEYCYGDYSMIHAFLVAHEFSSDVISHAHVVGSRKYVTGMRPAQSLEWNNVRLVRYLYEERAERLKFFNVDES